MTVPRLSAEQRRALGILADAGINGVTETTMLAHGFTRAAPAEANPIRPILRRFMEVGDVGEWGAGCGD
jgi:hypothetical protein